MYIQDTRVIKLTLSEPCDNIIKRDCKIYGISESHLIETVICEFCDCSEPFAKFKEKVTLDNVYDIISGNGEILFFRTILRLLAGSEHRHFHTKSAPDPYQWTITKTARKRLLENTLCEDETGNFIAEILEEYATMNNAARERILLRDKIATVKLAIKMGNEVNYTIRGNKKRMLPYGIFTERDSQYIYMIGRSVTEDGIGRPGSARFFSMSDIARNKTKYTIDKDAFEQYISGRDVAYLWADETEIVIGLTEKGEKTFNLLFNNRPAFKKTDEYLDCEKKFRIYKFTCTEFQAEVYFSSFGKEAKVISPASLVEKMKKFHSEALEVYSE